MQVCLSIARKAAAQGEVPVGSIVVYQNKIIGRGFNLRETTQDPTAHAEIIALRQASQYLNSWRLYDCDLYVTLEPCPMCAGALVNSRVRRVIYGCSDQKSGAVRSLYTLVDDTQLNHQVEVKGGVCQTECVYELQRFFRALRKQKKK